jgi:hypothetical protein
MVSRETDVGMRSAASAPYDIIERHARSVAADRHRVITLQFAPKSASARACAQASGFQPHSAEALRSPARSACFRSNSSQRSSSTKTESTTDRRQAHVGVVLAQIAGETRRDW